MKNIRKIAYIQSLAVSLERPLNIKQTTKNESTYNKLF